MKNVFTIHKLRLIVGGALIGSVLAGVCFGWVDLSFDPRTIGAALGAGLGTIASAAKSLHIG